MSAAVVKVVQENNERKKGESTYQHEMRELFSGEDGGKTKLGYSSVSSRTERSFTFFKGKASSSFNAASVSLARRVTRFLLYIALAGVC